MEEAWEEAESATASVMHRIRTDGPPEASLEAAVEILRERRLL
jgi:hypothetical protein